MLAGHIAVQTKTFFHPSLQLDEAIYLSSGHWEVSRSDKCYFWIVPWREMDTCTSFFFPFPLMRNGELMEGTCWGQCHPASSGVSMLDCWWERRKNLSHLVPVCEGSLLFQVPCTITNSTFQEFLARTALITMYISLSVLRCVCVCFEVCRYADLKYIVI